MIVAVVVLVLVYFFSSCNSDASVNDPLAADSLTIAKGEASFNQNCSGCHNFRRDGIGPQLGGLTPKVSADWILHFIKNPQEVIASGDERAKELLSKYKTLMPSFASIPDEELKAIVAFINTHKSVGEQSKEIDAGLFDPIPDTIALSNLRVNLKLLAQFPASSDSGKLPLTRITKLDFKPGTNDLFVVDLRGKLYELLSNDLFKGHPAVYLDLGKIIDIIKPKTRFIHEPGLATGFGSFAFHPDFKRNGLLYTTHTEPPNSGKADFGYADSIKVTLQWVLTEWKMFPSGEVQMREMLRVNMVKGIHGVQEITFNPLSKRGDKDYGKLYIGIGDGGSVESGYKALVHSPEKIWGTIIRIDPMGRNSANGQYGIPADNPFVNNPNSKTVKEIYAYGFRNPHRITWTSSGKMLVCNIGQRNIESLDLVMPGHDYGWPLREGTFLNLEVHENLGKVAPLPANDSVYKITYPVAQYDHDEGDAISGGFEYTGTTIPELKGKYLFGDITSGRLFYVNVADLKQGRQATIKEWKVSLNDSLTTLESICGSNRVDLHFGKDAHGELYILTKPDGKVYKLVSATTISNRH
jgi:glucose/arabinose dehydrogenase/mono/diheme cytochrome c family protein